MWRGSFWSHGIRIFEPHSIEKAALFLDTFGIRNYKGLSSTSRSWMNRFLNRDIVAQVSGLHIGCARRIGLASGLAQMYFRAETGRQVVLHIAFLDDAHGNS
jgi:hypothetical protein